MTGIRFEEHAGLPEELARNGVKMRKAQLNGKSEPNVQEDEQVADVGEASKVKAWPVLDQGPDLDYGLVGEIVRLGSKDSEVDPLAVMGTVVAYGGAVFG